MLHAVSCVDLKSLANSNYSMDIHGVIGAGWSWMEYLEKVSMSFTGRIAGEAEGMIGYLTVQKPLALHCSGIDRSTKGWPLVRRELNQIDELTEALGLLLKRHVMYRVAH
jgi:hypothetical protein